MLGWVAAYDEEEGVSSGFMGRGFRGKGSTVIVIWVCEDFRNSRKSLRVRNWHKFELESGKLSIVHIRGAELECCHLITWVG